MARNNVARVEAPIKIVCENRKARFSYHILEAAEAGIVLTGAEIKSVRAGHINLDQSFVRPEGDELFLIQAHIEPYRFNAAFKADPTRARKLLLHRRELDKFRIGVERKGLTIVPLKMYLKRGFAKVEIALARGKNAGDKRETVKKREADREARRAMKRA